MPGSGFGFLRRSVTLARGLALTACSIWLLEVRVLSVGAVAGGQSQGHRQYHCSRGPKAKLSAAASPAGLQCVFRGAGGRGKRHHSGPGNVPSIARQRVCGAADSSGTHCAARLRHRLYRRLLRQADAGQAGLCGSAVQPSRWRADAGVFAQPWRGACRAAGRPLSGRGRYPSIAGALREGRRWPERETEKKKHKIIENKYFL